MAGDGRTSRGAGVGVTKQSLMGLYIYIMGDGCSLNFVVSRTCCLQGADIFGADVYG
jgi:hypothetical protein